MKSKNEKLKTNEETCHLKRVIAMPARGATEMRLSEEAVQEVFAAATSNIPAEVIHKLVESAAIVFSKASKDPRECTRKLVVSHTWIMLPLTEASPSQTSTLIR